MAVVRMAKPNKKERLGRHRRLELKRRREELDHFGVVLNDIHSDKEQSRFFLCFIRAALIFMAVYGMLGGLVSSFDLPFSKAAVGIGLFILACGTAFLYYNKLSFYLGYALVFAGFIFFSVSAYWYINSGYQAFMNEVFNKYSDFFYLSSIREATEYIENRYLTVSAAMLFMGWFFSILLNISISGYMNLPLTFLITFLPLQIAFYVDIVPPMPYLVMLIAVYITVAVLGRSGHFTLPYRHAKGEQFELQFKKRKQRHVYLASSSGMIRTAIASVALAAGFLLLTGTLFAQSFGSKYVSNKLKDRTDDYVKNIVQGGLFSLLDRYRSTGGLNGGRLGGVGSIVPDFETDLVIRMVPYSSDNIYLKAFTGVTYENSSFFPYFSEAASGTGAERYISQNEMLENETYAPMLTVTGADDRQSEALPVLTDFYSKMWISNEGADQSYSYRPYHCFYTTADKAGTGYGISRWQAEYAGTHYEEAYSLLDDEEVIRSYEGEGSQESYEALYLPYTALTEYSYNPTITQEYERFVYDTYLQVPLALTGTLDAFLSQEGLEKNIMALNGGSITGHGRGAFHKNVTEAQFVERQRQRLMIAALLKSWFARNFEYTMSPGTTPRNRDFVEYFLMEQKRGFCAHFAASGVLLFRYMGIPARYQEGYMVTMSEIMDGRPISSGTEGWQIGDSGQEASGIVEVEVTDASAHAWIEIYIDGHGWIPYDLTPPSEEEQADFNLLGLFSGIFTQTQRNLGNMLEEGGQAEQTEDDDTLKHFFSGMSYLLEPVCWIAVAILLIAVLIPVVRYFHRVFVKAGYKRRGEYSKALLEDFKGVVRLMRKRKLPMRKNPTVRDVMTRLGAEPELAVAEGLEGILLESAYSGRELARERYEHASAALSDIRKKLGRNNSSGKNKAKINSKK